MRLMLILGLLWSLVATPVGLATAAPFPVNPGCEACCPLCTPDGCPCQASAPTTPAEPVNRATIGSNRTLDLVAWARPPSLRAGPRPESGRTERAPESDRARLARAPRHSILCMWTT